MAFAETIVSGEKEIAASNTAEQVLPESFVVTGFLVTAVKANAAVVRIGPGTVGASSYPLEAGESVVFEVVDPSRVWVYGKEKDKVKYIGLRP